MVSSEALVDTPELAICASASAGFVAAIFAIAKVVVYAADWQLSAAITFDILASIQVVR